MMARVAPTIAIACGGTGGHLFPGLAVAEQLVRHRCNVILLISPKEVDQQAAQGISGMEIVTLPAVGLSRGRALSFLRGFIRSYRAARKLFQDRRPHAALTMGGFTGAPPILAARKVGAPTFLHESNTIPGRANRWLAWAVDGVFVGFPQAAGRLRHRHVTVTGTPVRSQFHPRDAVVCRVAIGLQPAQPVLLVMGGSQGASRLNELVGQTLPLLAQRAPQLQVLHLTGPNDVQQVTRTCSSLNLKAVVHAFFPEMDLALGAASVAISRAGASSLAELAAMRVPAVLVPYPAATDNHQLVNARAYEQSGAAHLMEQKKARPEALALLVLDLLENAAARGGMQTALAGWHTPDAAPRIAREILNAVFPNGDAALAPESAAAEPGATGEMPSGKVEVRKAFTA
jgi:UDP-N-acetylglucosamine--N-acetylmuramyl-(pentapeptide) pyrophosphoryl-undecaprenol N-acetylglucosamine transferase